MKYLALSLFILSLCSSTLAQKKQAPKAVKLIVQGVCGIVLEKKGNHMPGPGRPASTGAPIEREVLIFQVLNMSQVETGDNGFINSVGNYKPVKTIKSGKDGKFCINLPVGQYSILVREPKGLYANVSDTHNNIFPVSVRKNSRSEVKVEITHQAAF